LVSSTSLVIFEGTGRHAGLEVAGNIERLLQTDSKKNKPNFHLLIRPLTLLPSYQNDRDKNASEKPVTSSQFSDASETSLFANKDQARMPRPRSRSRRKCPIPTGHSAKK